MLVLVCVVGWLGSVVVVGVASGFARARLSYVRLVVFRCAAALELPVSQPFALMKFCLNPKP